jgi:hypothetical protein
MVVNARQYQVVGDPSGGLTELAAYAIDHANTK